MAVRVIPARKRSKALPASASSRKIRVAAYCRVSTELEEQETSYESQIRHYRDLIREKQGWKLAGIYADEGISGTGTRKREEFNRMIADCEDGKIDLIVTKSISRFARNTLDCLRYIRHLKELGIPVQFEKERCNTMDEKGEFLITIMASIAQQESQSISKNVRMGIQYRFQQGKPMVQHSWFLGYTKKRGENLEIVPEEAETVRRIYRYFLEGMSAREIGNRLEREHVKTGAGRDKWYTSTIYSMLQNEKYMGDLLLQKGYTVDFLTKKRAKNDGSLPMYYVENAHEPIVPREVFQEVREEFLRRKKERLTGGKRKNQRTDLPLNEKIVCSRCGNTYRRFYAGSAQEADWRCRTRTQKGTPCKGRIVKDRTIREAVVYAMNELPKKRAELENMLSELGDLNEVKQEIERLEEREETLRDRLDLQMESVSYRPDILEKPMLSEQLEGTKKEKPEMLQESGETGAERPETLEKPGESKAEKKAVEELRELENHLTKLRVQKAEYDMKKIRIRTLLKRADAVEEKELQPTLLIRPAACYEYEDFMERTEERIQRGPVTAYDPDDVIRYIKRIVVYEERMEVEFKAGISVSVSL